MENSKKVKKLNNFQFYREEGGGGRIFHPFQPSPPTFCYICDHGILTANDVTRANRFLTVCVVHGLIGQQVEFKNV